MEAACGHTKIKKITWHEDYGQSSKFMCLDCNTDFVPVTSEIRNFLWRKQQIQPTELKDWETTWEPESPPDTSWAKTENIRGASRARHGVDCSCSKC